MSKKTLLNEATIRRFMKLAEIAPLTNGFISETEEAYKDDEDDFAADPGAEELPPGLEGEEEMDVELEEPMDVEEPMDAEEPAGDGEVELTLSPEQADALVALLQQVETAQGVAPEPEELPAPDMGDEGEELDVDLEEPAGEEEEEVEELEEIDVVDDDDLVNEVARRVAKRLLTKKNS